MEKLTTSKATGVVADARPCVCCGENPPVEGSRVCRPCVDEAFSTCPTCGKPVEGWTARRVPPPCAECDAKLQSKSEELVLEQLRECGVNVAEHGRLPLEETLKLFPTHVGDVVRSYIDDVLSAGRYDPVKGLWLQGPTGTGKTLLAASMARHLIETGALPPSAVVFERTRNLLNRVRDGYSSGTAQAIMSRVYDARFVVLDDLGTEHLTDDTLSNLNEILSQRASRPTVATLNFDRELIEKRLKAGAKGSTAIRDTMRRFLSRLGGVGWITLDILGPDHRQAS